MIAEEALADIETMHRLSKSLAMLDAILSPEWEYRYYSFNRKWAPGEEVASMRNGSGGFYFILFKEAGTILKGLDPESTLGRYNRETGGPWPGLFGDVPPLFSDFLEEPAFYVGEASFCLWRFQGDASWQRSHFAVPDDDDADGSEHLLAILDGSPATYKAWAEDYYELEVPLDAVSAVYKHEPLSGKLLESMNPDLTMSAIAADIDEIGYPAP